ncbi:hypothetical protein JL722_11858 [Aureococcus anophagefferens]|nr:hypothetical protein JL722_11858 [Aureococcus anophagefferens]
MAALGEPCDAELTVAAFDASEPSDGGAAFALRLCGAVEALPVALASERPMARLLGVAEALARRRGDGALGAAAARSFACHCCGLLTVRFEPLWAHATKVLAALDPGAKWPPLLALLQRASSAAAAAPSKKRRGGEPDAADLAADDDGALDADRSHAVAWDAAAACGAVGGASADSARAAVELFVTFLRVDLFDDGGDPDAKEILPLLPRACGDRYGRDSPLPGAARHRRLETLLRVFAGAAAPKSLPHGDALRAVYERLLGKPRGDVASLALKCLAPYKVPHLAPYAARVAALLDDATLRDTLIDDTHRAGLIPVLCRVLFGRFRAKSAAVGGRRKASPAARRATILSFLAALDPSELDAFLVLMFRPLLPSGGLDSLAPLRGREDAERAVAACSESRVSGLLQLLRAVVAKLGYRVEAHAGTFLGVVLAVLAARGEAEEEAVEDEEEDDEEEEVVDGSKSRRKRERHLALKCCKELLDQFAESDVLWAVDGGLKERLWAPLGSHLASLAGSSGGQARSPALLEVVAAACAYPSLRAAVAPGAVAALAACAADAKLALDGVCGLLAEDDSSGAALLRPEAAAVVAALGRALDGSAARRLNKTQLRALNALRRLFAASDRGDAVRAVALTFVDLARGHEDLRAPSLKAGADLVEALVAVDESSLDGAPDFEKAGAALQDLADAGAWAPLLADADVGALGAAPVVALLQTLARDSDAALRDGAARASRAFLAAAAAAASHGKTWTAEWVATTCLLPHVMGALELGDDGPRRAAVSALGAAAAKSSATFLAPAVALKRFANDNADLDLFENVAHLQAHRRARALKRAAAVFASVDLDDAARGDAARFLLPLALQPLYDARAQDALVKEAAACVGVVASALPWSRYGQLAKRLATVIENQARLHERLSRPKANSQQAPSGAASRKERPKFRDMQLQSSKALEATFVAAFCHVLDNFHFLDGADDAMDVEEEEEDEEEEEEDAEEEEEEADAPAQPPKADKVSAGLHGWLLPTARRLLKKPVRAKKTGARDEVLRAPVALAILRLAAKLPAAARDSETRGLVVSVCGGLRHRDATQRDVGRATLAKMVVFLSPTCLPLVLRELKAALHSGYMLAVRSAAVHSIVAALQSAGADALRRKRRRPRGDGRRPGRRGRGRGGLRALRAGEEDDARATEAGRCRAAVARVAAGFAANPSSCGGELVYHAVAILTRTGVVTRDAAPDVDESDSDDDSDDGSLAPLAMDEADMVPRRVRTNTGAATAWLPSAGDASSSKAEALARKRKREQENVAVIDGASAPKLTGRDRHGGHKLQSCDDAVKATATPLLGMLARAYRGLRGDEELQLGVVAVASALLGWKLEGAARWAPRLAKVALETLRRCSRFGGAPVGDGAQGAFKMLAALLGGKSDDGYEVSLADAQLKAVASSVRAALSESALADDDSFASNRAATYALLLAMVRRPVVVAEIYDVMDAVADGVAELQVTSLERAERKRASAILLKFVLTYPMGKKRMKHHLGQLLLGLDYAYEEGRLAALDALAAALRALPPATVDEHGASFFAQLAMRCGNEASAACAARVKDVLATLLGRVAPETRAGLLQRCLDFLDAAGSEDRAAEFDAAEKLASLRLLAARVAEAFAGHLDEPKLARKACLGKCVAPLHRAIDEERERDAAARDWGKKRTEDRDTATAALAQDVLQRFEDAFGAETVARAVGAVVSELRRKRDERKAAKKKMAVTDPAGFSKRKLARGEEKKAGRKRKAAGSDGVI